MFRLLRTTPLLHRYLTQRMDKRKFKNSIRSYSGMARLQWELEDILPLRLKGKSVIASYVDPDPADFDVWLNGKFLVAKDYVEDVLAHSDREENVAGIKFRYAIGTPWKAVRPDEARGLRVRLNHVGVGPRQYFELGVAGRTFSRLHWLTGEVNILSGLDEAITLDRDSLLPRKNTKISATSSGPNFESWPSWWKTLTRRKGRSLRRLDSLRVRRRHLLRRSWRIRSRDLKRKDSLLSVLLDRGAQGDRQPSMLIPRKGLSQSAAAFVNRQTRSRSPAGRGT